MKHPVPGIALVLLAALLALVPRAHAARQIVALFPPETDPAIADNVLVPAVPILEGAMKEQLGKRFDVRSVPSRSALPTEEQRRRKARSLGASHSITADLSRIGKGVTLDVTIAPVEDPDKGRTVVISGILREASTSSPDYGELFRRMGVDAAAKVNEIFFGTGSGTAGGKGTVPGLAGTIDRSGPIPGEVVSAAMSDLDRDGKWEIAAAYASEIGIYSLAGTDLKEKARIPDAGPGLFHVDARDIDRDGVAEIVAVRFIGRKAVSDIWRYDGTGYRRIASNLPYLLRVLDLGPEGVVLAGQESDAEKIYKGPVYRMDLLVGGSVAPRAPGGELPLPGGTFIFGFTPVKYGKEVRYVVLSSRDRPVYLDAQGKELSEGLDAFTGTDVPLGTVGEKVEFPARMAAADLNRDGIDEVIVMNTLVSAGTFFENLRIDAETELACLAQAGESLKLAWRSPQTDSSSRDLLLDSSRPGFPRIGLAARDRGKILAGATQWRLLWMK